MSQTEICENVSFSSVLRIENSDYKIATESIIEIEFIRPDSINKLKNKSINIWILTKKERMNNYLSMTTNYPSFERHGAELYSLPST